MSEETWASVGMFLMGAGAFIFRGPLTDMAPMAPDSSDEDRRGYERGLKYGGLVLMALGAIGTLITVLR